jgi:hypothetical protein
MRHAAGESPHVDKNPGVEAKSGLRARVGSHTLVMREATFIIQSPQKGRIPMASGLLNDLTLPLRNHNHHGKKDSIRQPQKTRGIRALSIVPRELGG